MKKTISILFGLLVLLGVGADAWAQEASGDVTGDPAVIYGRTPTTYRGECLEFDNADYYVRYVYLYAGQHTIAGRVTLSVQRRNGRYESLRVLYLTGGNGWDLLESHLYVGTEPPAKMAPGSFPYQQESANGSKRHDYYVDLNSLGASFDRVYVAIHAVVRKTDAETVSPKGDVIVVGQEETAWGFKTVNGWYPVIKPGELNEYGEPWGVIFPKRNKQWPAYLMLNIPYDENNSYFACPKPQYLIVAY